MAPRSPAHHEADSRRIVKGREPEWLRGYIGRKALAILVANQELRNQGHETMLSTGLAEALLLLRNHAGKTTNRQRVRLTA